MKRSVRKSITLSVALILMIGLMIPLAGAATDASDFFAGTGTSIIPVDGGKIIIEADALATEIMAELGVKEIILYERQSDGTYDDVKTWTRYNTTGMIVSNNYDFYKNVTYQGTVGTKYFTSVSFYAKNYDGLSETLTFDTEIVTAVAVAP